MLPATAATTPRSVGAGVSRRDESKEAKWHPTAGATEFLGIVETDSIRANPGNTAGSDGRHGQPNTRKLRRDGERAEDKA